MADPQDTTRNTSVTSDEVRKIASLARLTFKESEIAEFTDEFNKILNLFNKLNKYDTSKTEPMSHVLDDSNVLRADEATPSLDREEVLRAAPARKGSFFKAPLVIDS